MKEKIEITKIERYKGNYLYFIRCTVTGHPDIKGEYYLYLCYNSNLGQYNWSTPDRKNVTQSWGDMFRFGFKSKKAAKIAYNKYLEDDSGRGPFSEETVEFISNSRRHEK